MSVTEAPRRASGPCHSATLESRPGARYWLQQAQAKVGYLSLLRPPRACQASPMSSRKPAGYVLRSLSVFLSDAGAASSSRCGLEAL